jgi:hypothetical protein
MWQRWEDDGSSILVDPQVEPRLLEILDAANRKQSTPFGLKSRHTAYSPLAFGVPSMPTEMGA